MVHYLDLSTDVLDIIVSDELALEDGLARELLAIGPLDVQVQCAELAVP